jgi:hypothetical protein
VLRRISAVNPARTIVESSDGTPGSQCEHRSVAAHAGTGRSLLRKHLDAQTVASNLVDYGAERAAFTWDAARAALDGLPDGRGLNSVGYLAAERAA